jgi:hypothetical protein
MMPPKEDARQRRGAWAPGAYYCLCTDCEQMFIRDKRSVTCADCAYGKIK